MIPFQGTILFFGKVNYNGARAYEPTIGRGLRVDGNHPNGNNRLIQFDIQYTHISGCFMFQVYVFRLHNMYIYIINIYIYMYTQKIHRYYLMH